MTAYMENVNDSASALDVNDHVVRLNWLRAAVLGANDGIVSVAAIALGVAGAAVSSKAIAVAAVAGLVAGAMSMAMGEYVSVSAQRDSEKAEQARNGTKGHLTSAWHASGASFIAFVAGGVLPLIALLVSPDKHLAWIVALVVVVALAITGFTSAYLGRSPRLRAVLRNVIGGGAAMAVTYLIGHLLGNAVLA